METIKVIILPDGVTAKEVNPLGLNPITTDVQNNQLDNYFKDLILKRWQNAESSLRTFEIENIAWVSLGVKIAETETERILMIPGSTHTAEVLSTGKIKIL